MKIKITTGFRKDQQHSVDIEEAHKAYYLFLNPDARTVFSNGLALRGSDIQNIEPDYNETMGWYPSHLLDSDDWNQIRGLGLDTKFRDLLYDAKQIAQLENPKTDISLSEARKELLKLEN